LIVEGDIAAKDCLLRYGRNGRVLAVASINAILRNLQAELAMDRALLPNPSYIGITTGVPQVAAGLRVAQVGRVGPQGDAPPAGPQSIQAEVHGGRPEVRFRNQASSAYKVVSCLAGSTAVGP